MKPSTEPVAIAIVALFAAVACTRAGTVVDAAMIPSDVAAAEAKADGGRPPPIVKASGELPWKQGQRLRGVYYCAQGKTTLTVEIEDITGDQFDAVAEFDFPGAYKKPAAHGSWRMRGTFDASKKSVKLDADAWVDQPQNYVLVDLAGKVAADGSISGTVAGEGCSSFTLAVDKPSVRR